MLLLREMPSEHFLEIFLSTAARNFSKCLLKCSCAFPETAREYEYGTWQYQVRLNAGSWGTGVWSFSRLKTIPNFSAWPLLQRCSVPHLFRRQSLNLPWLLMRTSPQEKPCSTTLGWADLCWGPSSCVFLLPSAQWQHSCRQQGWAGMPEVQLNGCLPSHWFLTVSIQSPSGLTCSNKDAVTAPNKPLLISTQKKNKTKQTRKVLYLQSSISLPVEIEHKSSLYSSPECLQQWQCHLCICSRMQT